jgi:hypothetical protein
MVNYGIRIALGLAGIGLAAALPFLAGSGRPEAGQNRPGPAPQQPPPDEAAARARAWQRAETLLAGAEREAAAALDKHLAGIADFLARRKPGSRAFAEAVLGLRGKWELVKSQVSSGGDGEYAAFLQEAFSEHLFRDEDLEQAVAAAVRAYLAELEGIEARLLVRLRMDMADGEALPAALPALGSDEAFRGHYRELAGRVEKDLRTDLAYVAGREALSWTVLPELVNAVTRRIVTAVAVRAGFSSAGLAASTAFSAVTFGASLVAFFVLDYAIDQIIKAAGYDAEEKVAGRVAQALDDLGRILTDGDPLARATLEKLKTMQRDDPDPEVRAACVEAVQSIEAGARLFGLRGELTKIAAGRASVRKEALRRLIHNEVTP